MTKFKKGDKIAYKANWLREIKSAGYGELAAMRGTFLEYGKKYGSMQLARVQWEGDSEAKSVKVDCICKVGSTQFINNEIK